MSFLNLRVELRALRHAIEDLYDLLREQSKASRLGQGAEPPYGTTKQKVHATVTFDEQTQRDASAEHRQQHKTQNSMKRAAWCAFAAALVYAGVTSYQAYLMRRATTSSEAALALTAEQFRKQNRPYVWLVPGVAVGPEPMSNTTLPQLADHHYPLYINVKAANSGGTPAIKIQNTRVILIIDTPENAVRQARAYQPEYGPDNGSLAPGTSFFLPGQEMTITKDFLAKLSSKHLKAYILARIQYRDSIGAASTPPYESAICYMLNPTGMPFGRCDDVDQSWIR